MHRMLERLDSAASTLVPLLYLAGLALGAASYFAGITLDAGLAVGVALATAAELHSFLQQRRVRAAWAQLQRLPDDAPERDALTFALKVNAWILAALLIFSAFNATAFVALTWRPVPGWLPGWLQIGIRGVIIPAFFFLSGFLAPLHTDASEQLRSTSTDMLRRTLKAIGKQWRGRLQIAQRRNADLAPIAVALMRDASDDAGAHRVELIAAGLDATTATTRLAAMTALQGAGGAQNAQTAIDDPAQIEASQQPPTALQGSQQVAAYTAPDTSHSPSAPPVTPPDDSPPAGPGSPSVASKLARQTGKPTGQAGNVTPLRRGMGRKPRQDRKTASRANARSGRRGQAEQVIRAALASVPTPTHAELVKRTGVSSSTVSKYVRVIEAERRAASGAGSNALAQ